MFNQLKRVLCIFSCLLIAAISQANANIIAVNANTIDQETSVVLPSDIKLDSNHLLMGSGMNVRVGTFTTSGTPSGSYAYSLVTGSGSSDNSWFTIDGDLLRVRNLDIMSAGSYGVRIKTQDNANNSYEKSFIIVISDPNLGSVSSTGSSTNAKITGEIQFDDFVVANGSTTEVTTKIDIAADIVFDPVDQGKEVDILVVAGLTDGLNLTTFYMLTPSGWQVWDGRFETLMAKETITASTSAQRVQVVENLMNLAGTFNVYVGYRLDGGEVIYSPKPLNFIVR